MTLIYLSKANLQDRLFLKDFFANAGKLQGNAVVVHEGLEDHEENIRFVGKRISAQLSEAMVTNTILNGNTRGFVQGNAVKTELIEKYTQTLQALVVNGAGQLSGRELYGLLHAALQPETAIVFTENPMAALVQEKATVDSEATLAKLLAAYPEEETAIRLAAEHVPTQICGPINYAQ